MTKWFSEVFLPSLFDRYGTQAAWLSRKQAAICTDNMARQQVRYDADGYGTMCNHDNYFCEWNGRRVILSYSKKNGCGQISFSMTVEEAKASRDAFVAKREAERIRIRENVKLNKPERVAKHIEKASAKVKSLEKELIELREELADTKDPEVEEEIVETEGLLKEAQKELNFWIA